MRIYNRALSAAEVQTDMNLPVPPPGQDAAPPTAPGGLTATVGTNGATLNWSAATDNRGVTHYNVYRATTSGFTPTAANRIAQPTGTSYADTDIAAGVYYYKVTAEDAAGNVGPSSNQASAVLDTTPPSAPGTLTAAGGVSRVDLSWGAATDDVGVAHYDLHRGTSPGFTPGTANRIAQPQGTSYTDTGLPAGTFYYKVIAVDVAGNQGPASNESAATVTVDDTPPEVSLTAPQAGDGRAASRPSPRPQPPAQGVAGVQFQLDGRNLGAEDTAAPFTSSLGHPGELNGAHTLSAVARDTASATATSAPVTVTVSNAGVSTAGLQAAYSFDDQIGTAFVDAVGQLQDGTLTGGDWTSAGRYGGAASLSGSNAEVDPPALGTFYKTGFTFEAWVYKQTSKVDVAVVGSWTRRRSDDLGRPRHRPLPADARRLVRELSRLRPLARSRPLAARRGDLRRLDARIYVDGVLAASSTFTGDVGSSNTWRIGAYGSPAGGFFDGLIDNVRIYSRALTARRGPDGHGIPHPTGSSRRRSSAPSRPRAATPASTSAAPSPRSSAARCGLQVSTRARSP